MCRRYRPSCCRSVRVRSRPSFGRPGIVPNTRGSSVPVLDGKGRVRHDGGVTPVPGLYLMSATFLRRRRSTFIDGAGDDARELSAHLVDYLDGSANVP